MRMADVDLSGIDVDTSDDGGVRVSGWIVLGQHVARPIRQLPGGNGCQGSNVSYVVWPI
jgi:hypothetical protein